MKKQHSEETRQKNFSVFDPVFLHQHVQPNTLVVMSDI